MPRIVKRYENRKLYDTTEKRYVSLDDIAGFVRAGEEVEVVDNATGADLTAHTLAKVILEATPGGALQPQFLHDLVRASNRLVEGGREQLQQGFDRLIEASLQRLGPVREVREELARMRARVDDLERLIEQLLAEEEHGNHTE